MEDRTTLKDISPNSWEHPADRAALSALKTVPGIDTVLKFFLGNTNEKQFRMLFLATSVRVGENQFPGVYKQLHEACRILDVDPVPELYVQQTPFFNAGALGVERPFLTINSSTLDILDEEELLYVIGHELGHCISGHVLYKTLLAFLMNVSSWFLRFPGIALVMQGLLFALREWDRKSELSADRAGLLTVQNPAALYTALMKMTGGGKIGEMDLSRFLDQAAEYDRTGNAGESFFKFINMLTVSHPFPVIRLPEIKAWRDGGSYEAILEGNYERRDGEVKRNMFNDFEEARRQYREDMDKSEDPLARLASDLGKTADRIGKGAGDFLSSLFHTEDEGRKE